MENTMSGYEVEVTLSNGSTHVISSNHGEEEFEHQMNRAEPGDVVVLWRVDEWGNRTHVRESYGN